MYIKKRSVITERLSESSSFGYTAGISTLCCHRLLDIIGPDPSVTLDKV